MSYKHKMVVGFDTLESSKVTVEFEQCSPIIRLHQLRSPPIEFLPTVECSHRLCFLCSDVKGSHSCLLFEESKTPVWRELCMVHNVIFMCKVTVVNHSRHCSIVSLLFRPIQLSVCKWSSQSLMATSYFI